MNINLEKLTKDDIERYLRPLINQYLDSGMNTDSNAFKFLKQTVLNDTNDIDYTILKENYSSIYLETIIKLVRTVTLDNFKANPEDFNIVDTSTSESNGERTDSTVLPGTVDQSVIDTLKLLEIIDDERLLLDTMDVNIKNSIEATITSDIAISYYINKGVDNTYLINYLKEKEYLV